MARLRCMGCMREYDEKKHSCPYCKYPKNARPEYSYALQPETVLQARYVVGKVLRCGEEELIYLGWDQVLEKRIAVKEYYPRSILKRDAGQKHVCLRENEMEERYRSGRQQYILEAKELARFREETGIIRIYDYFEENGTVYIITEYSDNYQKEDIETRMLYLKANKKKQRQYIGRVLLGVELVVAILVWTCALLTWNKPYSFSVSESEAAEGMPDVTGEMYEQAKKELESVGLQVTKEDYETDKVAQGQIVRQSEEMGDRIIGQPVTLWVACTPKKVANDLSEEEAGVEETAKKDAVSQESAGESNSSSSQKIGPTTQSTGSGQSGKSSKTDKDSDGNKKTEKKTAKKTTQKSTESQTATEKSTEVIVIED